VLSAADAEHLTLMATRAPSLHNSQPWRLVVTPEGLDVRADRCRQVLVIDPLGRQLLASCGALVHHLVVAARALGFGVSATVLPEPHDRDLVARLRLTSRAEPPAPADVALAEALLYRSTDRRRFSDDPVTSASIERLRHAVEAQGAMLAVIRDEDRVAVDVLAEHAEQGLLSEEAYRQELRSWVFDPVRDGERDDGIPVTAVDGGGDRAEELPGRRFLPRGSGRQSPRKAERPTVLVLTTSGDQPSDWVRSGMALSALLLDAAQSGLVAQPIGQVTDVANERARLRQDLHLVGVPQLVLRLGRSAGRRGLQTPRRPVGNVLTWATTAAASG
jgi:nitroreductase